MLLVNIDVAIVAVAVEQRRHTAGSARLAVLERVSFQRDLGPFLLGVIDAHEAAVRTVGTRSQANLHAAPLSECGTSPSPWPRSSVDPSEPARSEIPNHAEDDEIRCGTLPAPQVGVPVLHRHPVDEAFGSPAHVVGKGGRVGHLDLVPILGLGIDL